MEEDSNPLSGRAKKAAIIKENPAGYKVCEGCESIVSHKVATCPNCNAYRFDAATQKVVEQAEFLATRERRSVISEDLL